MKLPPLRFWVAVIGVFMTTFTNYIFRINLAVSIVGMVSVAKNASKPACAKPVDPHSKPKKKVQYYPTYKWSEQVQGYLLQSYFIGYTVTCLPAGILAEYVGPWNVILWPTLASTVVNALTPIAAKAGPKVVWALRFILGLFGGLVYPAVNVLISRWAPPDEKGRFLGAMMGNTLGSVYAWTVGGAITYNYASWQWGFYSLSITVFVYCVVFFFVVSDSPQSHRWISEEEKNYIVESHHGTVSLKKAVPPYGKILTSIRFWALILCQFGNLWALNLMGTYFPKFMSSTLGFNIKDSAGLSSLPNVARLICSNIFGFVGDYLLRKNIMSKTKLRKCFVVISHFIPAACLLLILAAGCNHVPVIALLVLSQAFNGAVVVGHLVNCQELAPNFAGTLYGIMNFVANMSGFIVPPISGLLMTKYHNRLPASQWIFTLGAIMFASGGLVFILLGTAETQPWNKKKDDVVEESEQK